MKHMNTTQEVEPVKRPKTPGQEAYMPIPLMPEIKEEMDVEQFNQGFESPPNQSYNCDCGNSYDKKSRLQKHRRKTFICEI